MPEIMKYENEGEFPKTSLGYFKIVDENYPRRCVLLKHIY